MSVFWWVGLGLVFLLGRAVSGGAMLFGIEHQKHQLASNLVLVVGWNPQFMYL